MTLSHPPTKIQGHFLSLPRGSCQCPKVQKSKSLLKMTDELKVNINSSEVAEFESVTRCMKWADSARTDRTRIGPPLRQSATFASPSPLRVTSRGQGDAHPAVLRRYITVLACAPGKTEHCRFVHERESRLGYYMPRCRPLLRQSRRAL